MEVVIQGTSASTLDCAANLSSTSVMNNNGTVSLTITPSVDGLYE
jgi:hypothetical protein